MSETWLTIPEAMEYWKIKSRSTIHKLVKDQKFIARRIAHRIRIHKELTDMKLLKMPEFKIC